MMNIDDSKSCSACTGNRSFVSYNEIGKTGLNSFSTLQKKIVQDALQTEVVPAALPLSSNNLRQRRYIPLSESSLSYEYEFRCESQFQEQNVRLFLELLHLHEKFPFNSAILIDSLKKINMNTSVKMINPYTNQVLSISLKYILLFCRNGHALFELFFVLESIYKLSEINDAMNSFDYFAELEIKTMDLILPKPNCNFYQDTLFIQNKEILIKKFTNYTRLTELKKCMLNLKMYLMKDDFKNDGDDQIFKSTPEEQQDLLELCDEIDRAKEEAERNEMEQTPTSQDGILQVLYLS